MPYIGDDYSTKLNFNRKGSFYISEETMVHHPDLVRDIMDKVFVTRCEFNYAARRFDYVAISDLFEEVEAGKEKWRCSF